MEVTIDLGKLLEYYDKNAKKYDINCGDGFRAFILDFVCDKTKETSTETNYQHCRPVVDDIRFKHCDTATQVLKKMRELVATRGFATIADYYHFAYRKPTESIMCNWGWRDMKGTYVYCYSYCGETVYSIRFPDAMPIEHY